MEECSCDASQKQHGPCDQHDAIALQELLNLLATKLLVDLAHERIRMIDHGFPFSPR